jgi:hypothetical protein
MTADSFGVPVALFSVEKKKKKKKISASSSSGHGVKIADFESSASPPRSSSSSAISTRLVNLVPLLFNFVRDVDHVDGSPSADCYIRWAKRSVPPDDAISLSPDGLLIKVGNAWAANLARRGLNVVHEDF